MAKPLERLRQAADDFLRLAGFWALFGATVTTLLISAGVGIVAYLRGVRGEWLIYVAGIASGTLIVLVITVILWAIHRIRIQAALKRDSDATAAAKGFLDYKLEQRIASAALLRLIKRMSALSADIGVSVSRSAKAMTIFASLPEARRDRIVYWIANRTARKMGRLTVRFAAVVNEYERTARSLTISQGAFLEWALRQKQNQTELQQLRDAITVFRNGFATANAAQRDWKNVLTRPDSMATSRLIAAANTLAVVLDRSIGVNDGLEAHASSILQLLDARLGASGG